MDDNKLLNELFIAYFSARKNKRNTLNQLRFEMNFESNLVQLNKVILDRTYTPQRSICFIVEEPVKREIFAADFIDRVIHHLIYNQIAPLFENLFIADTYSCLKGRGTLYGIKRLEQYIRKCSENYTKECYVLKLDISSYFMSIDKKILFYIVKTNIEKKFDLFYRKNRYKGDLMDKETILFLIEKTIFCEITKNSVVKGKITDWTGLPKQKSLFHSNENCGLPIGNLTSQLFSNIYLNQFDQYVKRELKIKHYGRYVDDFYMVHQDKEYLKNIIGEIKTYLDRELNLTLHPKKIYLQNIDKGIAFVGAIIKPHRRYVGKRTVRNFKTKLWTYKHNNDKDIANMTSSINSYLGNFKKCNSYNLRKKIILQNKWLFNYGWIRNDYTRFRMDAKYKTLK